tara:strand:+ start:205 stop:816 length:612 start_codon:yes stop_codon:yes gene_type:complete
VTDQDTSRFETDKDSSEQASDQEALASANTDVNQPEGVGGEGIGDVEAELAKLRSEMEVANDLVLRTQAELENFRKRSRREIVEERRYATLPLLRDVLPVVDNLRRAIESVADSNSFEGLLEGVKLVAAQLDTVLTQHDCQLIDALEAEFDPNFHEAISQIPSQECPAGKVVHVSQVGYRLHDRVIRPSQVVVSTGPPAESDE